MCSSDLLCPDFPPRLRSGQDMDFACMSKERKKVGAYLEQSGCEPDRRFNSLSGHQQMYFLSPARRPIDIMVDQLTMCHNLDLRPSFSRQPFTIDAMDVLLSKLQIVEMNAKDARDITHLLSGVPVGNRRASGPFIDAPFIDTGRFGEVLAADWGWWRTTTGSLEKMPAMLAENLELIPPRPRFDVRDQVARLLEVAKSVPKSMKWKLRANVGDRVRWYELPEEVAH